MNDCLTAWSVSFEHKGRRVLDGVTISVTPGRITALMGPNGSGKSTLIWLLAGLWTPCQGLVGLTYDGRPSGPGDIRAPRFPLVGLGMAFQQGGLWEHLSVQRHLMLVAGKAANSADVQANVERTLDMFKLQDLRRRVPGQLSGGQRQRLSIARAMLAGTKWILLDEPLSHLDTPGQHELLDILEQALTISQAGILLSLHDPQTACRLADNVVILNAGRIVQQGHPNGLMLSPSSETSAS